MEARGSASGRVVVADDSDIAAQKIGRTLAEIGFEVRLAYSGPDALALAREWSPDAVICDLHMPEMDGLAVMRRLAAIDDAIPLIMLTSDDRLDNVLNAVHEGVFDFVQKGPNLGVLGRAVGRAVEHGRMVRENRRLAAELRATNASLEERVADRTAELERSLEALYKSEARFRSLVQNAFDVITVLDEHGNIRYASPSTERVLGPRPEGRLGRSLFDEVRADSVEAVRAFLEESVAQPGSVRTGVIAFAHADGTPRYLEVSLTNLLADPSVSGIVLNGHDVTERAALERELMYEASHDTLTRLPNRTLFRKRLHDALSHVGEEGVVVMFVDLDGFKSVNDHMGHAAGDDLLFSIAERLRGCVREVDMCARLGGDEFALLLPGLSSEDACGVAKRLRDALAEPFLIRGKSITVGASVGVAVSTSGDESVDELLRHADLAMYTAKARRDGSHELFVPSLQEAMKERLELESELSEALQRGDLYVHYQPIVDIEYGSLVGAEALVRWQHPARGVIGPAVFIPMAEESGLIVQIGRWVMLEACREARRWRDRMRETAPRAADLKIHVNLSPRQLRDPGLLADVERALAELGGSPEALVLEITESLSLEDGAPALRALKGLGVSLAVDDFGTGYASLGSLRKLDVDVIKIHKSFVESIGTDASDAELARTAIRLGQALGVRTTAEGIETRAQWEELRRLGCDFGQGHLFSRAVGPEEMRTLVARRLLAPIEPLATGTEA